MLVHKAELEQLEHERKKENDELSLINKAQLKNIILDYNARAREDTETKKMMEMAKNV